MHLSFTPLKQVKCVHLGALLQVAGFSSLSDTFGAASDWADLAQTPRWRLKNLLRYDLVAELDGFSGVDVGQQAHVFKKWQWLQQQQWGQIRWGLGCFLRSCATNCNHVCSSRVIHSRSLKSDVKPCPAILWGCHRHLESLQAFESSSSQASSKEEEEVEEEKTGETGEDGEETVQKVLESYKLESWCFVFCCRPTCDKYCLVFSPLLCKLHSHTLPRNAGRIFFWGWGHCSQRLITTYSTKII